MPQTTFNQRQEQFSLAEAAAQHQHNQLAFWRLVWFAGSIAIIWILIRLDQQLAAVATLIIGSIGFLILLKKHQAIRYKRDLAHQLASINQDEAARLERRYMRSETGEQFISPTHYYAGDLDVFGKHSLFRLLNRTHTHKGQSRLAGWLLAPAGADTVQLRQQAVAELVPQLEWRQQVEALAYLEETIGRSPDALVEWATSSVSPLPGYLKIIRYLFPSITLGIFMAWLMGYAPGLAVIAALGVHGLVLSQTAARAKEASEYTHEISVALRAFQGLFRQAEALTGDSVRIRAIRQALTAGGRPVSDVVGQLAKLTEGLNFRRNPYFALLFGIATLWDVQYLFGLERWKNQYGADMAQWLEALGELEALNSLAGFAYAHPTYTTPAVTDGQLLLDITSAAHPLLAPDRSVSNSLQLVGAGQTVLITGSNMSGKSTFLRTVGANVVLALAGAVVSAAQFQCSPVRVFTSMRTQDSLEESTSSFYAELKRLQTLIGLSKQTDAIPVLYFLDEILKGTNSADRHRGAEALIRQLHRTSASGFVSTHDLELGQLTDASDFVRNFHFQSDLINGELVFDYKLRTGICESFNASQLMRAIGIEVGEN
jgi:ABC-type multidrug transport system fused ATPase/permease subunit